MVFPYPFLLKRFSDAWVIGLSGTLRDSHLVITDMIRLESELQTLAENLPGVRIITMEEIMAGDEEFNKHVIYTYLRTYPIRDRDIQELFQQLDKLIVDYRRKIR